MPRRSYSVRLAPFIVLVPIRIGIDNDHALNLLPMSGLRHSLWIRRFHVDGHNTINHGTDPLRILFCGSDYFSIESLRRLFDYHQRNKDLISSINVVCRAGKPVGRGLKQIRHGCLRLSVLRFYAVSYKPYSTYCSNSKRAFSTIASDKYLWQMGCKRNSYNDFEYVF